MLSPALCAQSCCQCAVCIFIGPHMHSEHLFLQFMLLSKAVVWFLVIVPPTEVLASSQVPWSNAPASWIRVMQRLCRNSAACCHLSALRTSRVKNVLPEGEVTTLICPLTGQITCWPQATWPLNSRLTMSWPKWPLSSSGLLTCR